MGGHGGGKFQGFVEAARIGAAGAGVGEIGAVFHGGANDGQAKRDVHPAPDAEHLGGDVALVVIHGHAGVEFALERAEENRVAGERAVDIQAEGDLHIDGHHTVEDVGITLGQAVAQAVGDKKGIMRYGHAYVPLDEALSRVVVDFSGRPGIEMHVPFKSGMVGAFDTQLTYEFFQGFVNHAFVSLHIDNLRGENAHHQAETVFKAFGRALRAALQIDPRAADQIASTKGSL